jgi:glycosyltransferase involved in cell wall biosynthesis
MSHSAENKNPPISNENPGVSIVLCCFNSAGVIEPTVKALAKQLVPKGCGYEVILVDNNCTDGTVALAEENWKNLKYPLRIVKENQPGLIHARKRGVEEAQYHILLFVDDDNILAPDWIEKLAPLYQKMPRVGAIGGYNQPLLSGAKPAWFDHYQQIYACGPRHRNPNLDSRKLFGAGLSFRTGVVKSVLFSPLPLFLVGRTRNTLIRGEDTEMSLRCLLSGWDFYYDDSLVLQHNLLRPKVNWAYVCQARKMGGIAGIVLKIYRDLLAGREPLTQPELHHYVRKMWREYLGKHRKYIFHIKKAGSESSFLFYRLLGMSKGLILYRKTYPDIRRRILEYYKPRSSKVLK